MTTRIDRRFATLKTEGRAALVTFLTAGDPDADTSLAILKALPKAGADVIELGMPFTDPMADGPAIQASSQRALKAGQDMKTTLAMVRSFRAADDATPIVLMETSARTCSSPSSTMRRACRSRRARFIRCSGCCCRRVIAAAAMALSSVSVIGNALRLNRVQL